jgi:hypothetical protein
MGEGGTRKIEILRARERAPKQREETSGNQSPSISVEAIALLLWYPIPTLPATNLQNVIYTLAQFCQYSKILLSFY